jgi:hypothetical protein
VRPAPSGAFFIYIRFFPITRSRNSPVLNRFRTLFFDVSATHTFQTVSALFQKTGGVYPFLPILEPILTDLRRRTCTGAAPLRPKPARCNPLSMFAFA